MTETVESVYAQVRTLTARGLGAHAIARQLEISEGTVYRARKAAGAARWEGTPYTCEDCSQVTLRPRQPSADARECLRCGSPAYPPLSDAEVLRRLTALVQRLEAEPGCLLTGAPP